MRVFHSSFNRGFLFRVWVSRNHLKFFLILMVLWSGSSRFFLWFPFHLNSFSGRWEAFQQYQLQLLTFLLSSFPSFSLAFRQDLGICLSFHFLLLSENKINQFSHYSAGTSKSTAQQYFFKIYNYHWILPSGQGLVIHLHLGVTESVMRFIFQGKFHRSC